MGKRLPKTCWADSKINKIVIVESSRSFILFTYLKKNLANNACCSFCHTACNICRCVTSCPHVARRRETTSIIFCNPVNSTSAKFYCCNIMIVKVALRLIESSCVCVRSVREVTLLRWDSCSWETLLYLQPATNRESQKLIETRTNVSQWCK